MSFLSRKVWRLKRSTYRTWHRIVFLLGETTGVFRCPAQTIFVHVPKTAGSSINEYLSSFFGSRRSSRYIFIDKFWGEAYKADISADALKKAQSARCVTGHVDWQVVEKIRQPHAFVFTILRDPAGRLLSNYHYLHRKLKSLTFEQFCTSDDPDVLYTTNNLMVRQLASRINGTEGLNTPFEELLAQALKNLASMDYVGFQQTLDHDFEALVKKTGFPLLRLPQKNITAALKTHNGSPIYNASASKEDILKLAAPRLKWDMELYQRALALAPEINRKPFIRA
jgi:hypothetical protein